MGFLKAIFGNYSKKELKRVKPIIATRVRGTADLVENILNGYVEEIENCDEKADRIYEINNQ